MEYIFKAIDSYALMLQETVVPIEVFAIYTFIIVAVGLVRLFFLFGFEKLRQKRGLSGYKKVYIFGHVCYETLVSYIVAYFIIKMTGAHWGSPIINFIIAPACGVIAGVIVDNKFIVPNETMLQNATKDTNKKNKKEKSENNITVNINNNSSEDNSKRINHIPEEVAESDDFNSIIINAINCQSDRIDKTIDILDVLKNAEISDKKIELKKMMYDCLDKGFATPQENDKITINYQSYINLGGNGEISELYKNHYLKLKVHEDRRTGNNCEYGRYDG